MEIARKLAFQGLLILIKRQLFRQVNIGTRDDACLDTIQAQCNAQLVARRLTSNTKPATDKQFVRDWLEAVRINGKPWDKTPPAPRLPDEVIARTAAKYQEALTQLTA